MNWLDSLKNFGRSDGLEPIDMDSIALKRNIDGNPIARMSTGRPDFLSMDGVLGTKNSITGVETPGWGGLALDSAQALGGAWMGMKQYGMAKDQLKFQKDAFNKNYAAQKQTLNSQLEDRQRARVGGSAGQIPVAEYMAKYGIK